MGKSEILTNIKLTLASIGYDYELLSNSQKNHLEKIELEVSKRLTVQKHVLNSLKTNKINIASIAIAIGITRKTVYNNHVLKNYIEFANQLYENNCPENAAHNLKDQVINVNEKVSHTLMKF